MINICRRLSMAHMPKIDWAKGPTTRTSQLLCKYSKRTIRYLLFAKGLAFSGRPRRAWIVGGMVVLEDDLVGNLRLLVSVAPQLH